MMNKRFNTFKTMIISIMIAGTLSGCQSGGPSLPTRKKMPELAMADDDFEGSPVAENGDKQNQNAYAFNAQNVDLMINGISQGFISLSLPDASADSATVNLLQSLKPFALPLLSNWAQQQRHGVAIDLSAHNGETIHRSDFVLQETNGFSFPVVVIWDRLSQYRLATIRQLVAEVPSLKLNAISAD
jgi:hypothetical protein